PRTRPAPLRVPRGRRTVDRAGGCAGDRGRRVGPVEREHRRRAVTIRAVDSSSRTKICIVRQGKPEMSRLRALSILTAAWWFGGAAGFVAAASAQEPTKQERVRAAFSGEAARELERLLADARDRGLPAEPLLDKALEGAAKGVPAERVLAVVAQLSTGLGRARAILAEDGSPPVPADVVAVADGLRRGVPERAVSRLRTEAGPDEPIALAVHTLADLLDRGVPVDAALD